MAVCVCACYYRSDLTFPFISRHKEISTIAYWAIRRSWLNLPMTAKWSKWWDSPPTRARLPHPHQAQPITQVGEALAVAPPQPPSPLVGPRWTPGGMEIAPTCGAAAQEAAPLCGAGPTLGKETHTVPHPPHLSPTCLMAFSPLSPCKGGEEEEEVSAVAQKRHFP